MIYKIIPIYFYLCMCICMMIYLFHASKALNIESKVQVHELSDYRPLIIARHFPGED